MSDSEKNELLDSLAEPFGYRYVPEWDVFSSRVDAWQKQFGYGTVYDRAASYFNMVLETLPVYFDYDGKTWLIQIWKGQYGICTGCEVGVYHADRIVAEKEREITIFRAADEIEMLPISTELRREGTLVAFRRERHWWLTTFDVGTFSQPEQLSLKISIRFPDPEMQSALAQWINRFNCKLFNFVTRSCTGSRDRILYLYFYFPFACRHILRIRHVPGKRR